MKHLTDTIRDALEKHDWVTTEETEQALTTLAELERLAGEPEFELPETPFQEVAPGLEVGYDFFGGVDIRLGGEFVYVHINYDHRYTHNSARAHLADQIVGLLTGKDAAPPAQQPHDRVAVTWDKDRTRILAVTLQDADGRVLCVIDEAPAQQQYEAGDMASAHNDGFRAGAASVAQQPQETEVQCPVCSHKFYEWPNDKQPQAAAVHNKPVRVCHIKDVACSEAAVKCGECPDAAPQQAEAVPAAMKVVLEAMRSDPDYAWSWHCNVAMAFVDAGGDHYTANQGAARFMRLLAGVEPAHELPEAPQQAEAVQACGHPMSLLLRSAESNEPLYCEACDDKSGRHDAERRETELLDVKRHLQEKIASADALKLHAIEELCQLGYTVKDGELIPPDHLHKLVEAAGHPLTAPQQAEAVPPGYVLVPVEPTLEMGWAYLDAANAQDPLRHHVFNHDGYRAMLAAAQGEKPCVI